MSTTTSSRPQHEDSVDAPVVEFKSIRKRFRRGAELITAVDNIDLTVQRGEFICIVGPSGCGKSTLLNMTAGVMEPSSGDLRYDGQELPMPNTSVGYVTQKDNLMPWRTVEDNVGIALEIRGVSKGERKSRVSDMLEMVGLTGFGESFPAQLSGGMRKRASLARTLIYEPNTILADEPFGALDAQLKLLMQSEFLRIWSRTGSKMTTLFVTHDLSEAITLADRVIVMSSRPGHIKLDERIQLERPRDVMTVRFSEKFGHYHERLWQALSGDIELGETV